MSPVGGQGLNIALRDVIAAANELVPVLRGGCVPDAVDEACSRIEVERVPELRTIQRLQALPPRVVLSRAWWGEPVRSLFGALLRTGFGQRVALSNARVFQSGVGEVRLRV
jgi:2-polyprenyl-6-methoxyphenol hydroxylase-like FAD-dependent oxidoreductase